MMKAGRVVRLRISPKDCMSVDDIVRKVHMFTPGMSFSQAASITLAALIETFRKQGHVPIRDGFEFTEMMNAYPKDQYAKRRQIDITRTIDQAGSEIEMPVMPGMIDVESSPQVKRLYMKLQELAAKRDADPENWSEAEQVEYKKLEQELVKLT